MFQFFQKLPMLSSINMIDKPGMPQLTTDFKEWDKPSRQSQICVIAALTALFYVIFTFLDKSWAPDSVKDLLMAIHLCLIVPYLCLISFLACRKKHYNFVLVILAIFPMVSMSCHALVASKVGLNTQFLAEGYLGVLWIFILSGLTFNYAVVSASVTSLILVISAYFYIESVDSFSLYTFWIFCSFSFGIIAAYIHERSRKTIYFNQQELQLLATTDPLTGVFNRNQMNHVLIKEVKRQKRRYKPFSMLLIDIDHFKKINDTKGHEHGDVVLKGLAKLLSNSIREIDTLVRWGGEEFVIIANDMNDQNTIQLGEHLRKVVADATFAGTQITVSIGATIYQQNETKDALFLRADKALYKAKTNGRNQVVFS